MKKVNNIALDGELRKNCYYVIMSFEFCYYVLSTKKTDFVLYS